MAEWTASAGDTPKTGRASAPSPHSPGALVIPAKAGTYWRDVRARPQYPLPPRSRRLLPPDGALRAPSPPIPTPPVIPAKAGTYPLPRAAPRAQTALICAQKALIQRSPNAHSALIKRSNGAHGALTAPGRRKPPPSASGAPTQRRVSRKSAPRRKPVSPPSPSRFRHYDTTSLRSATPPAILDPN